MSAVTTRIDMLDHLHELEVAANALTTALSLLPDKDYHLLVTDIDYATNKVRIIKGYEVQLALNIYAKIGYQDGQDSRSAFRRPGVIQIHPKHESAIAPRIEQYNEVKARIVSFHQQLSRQWPLMVVKELWQSTRSMLCLKQLFRYAQMRRADLTYAGLSVVTKPVVKKLTKQGALDAIAVKREHIPVCVDVKQYLNYLDEKEAELMAMDETRYSFRLARKGAPRPVLNIKDNQGKPSQIMASMPVIIFTSTRVDVSLPKPKRERERRSDAFINLDPVAGNQIKAIPLTS